MRRMYKLYSNKKEKGRSNLPGGRNFWKQAKKYTNRSWIRLLSHELDTR